MVMNAQYFGEKLEKEAKYQWELSEYLKEISASQRDLMRMDIRVNFLN